jgi:hypothetical protein
MEMYIWRCAEQEGNRHVSAQGVHEDYRFVVRRKAAFPCISEDFWKFRV